jgi:uncharacterized membrane protein
MAQRTQLWWTFTFLSAGLGTIVTLMSASNLARRSVVTLVVLGAMLFSVSFLRSCNKTYPVARCVVA